MGEPLKNERDGTVFGAGLSSAPLAPACAAPYAVRTQLGVSAASHSGTSWSQGSNGMEARVSTKDTLELA
eukprot:scaffold3579_cov75-Phaeocystis_antarctica.AAC.1